MIFDTDYYVGLNLSRVSPTVIQAPSIFDYRKIIVIDSIIKCYISLSLGGFVRIE